MPGSSSASLHWAPSARSLLWAPIATRTTGLGTGCPGRLADLSWLTGPLFLGSMPPASLVAPPAHLPAWGPAQVMGSPRAFALPGPSPPQSAVPGLQPDHQIQAMRPPPVSWSSPAAVTSHPRPSALNSKPRFLTVLEAASPRSRCWPESASGENLTPIQRWPTSCCVLLMEGQGALGVSFRGH